MFEKFKFSGKGFEDSKDKIEKAEDANSDIFQSEQKGFDTKFYGEVEKTEAEIQNIYKIGEALKNELSDMGIAGNFKIDPRQFHFILADAETLKRGHAYLNPKNNQIVIYRLNEPVLVLREIAGALTKEIFDQRQILRENETMRILHEMTHSLSHRKYELSEKEANFTGIKPFKYVNVNHTYRVGYHMESSKRKNHETVMFEGFNEAVVQKTTLDILDKLNTKEIEKQKNATSPYYQDEIQVLNKIIEKISEYKKLSKEEVWRKIKKEQFTGHMMHLRDVEKAFGEGSLYLLATMHHTMPKEKKNLYLAYFSTEDPELRSEIGKELLGDRE